MDVAATAEPAGTGFHAFPQTAEESSDGHRHNSRCVRVGKDVGRNLVRGLRLCQQGVVPR